MEFDLDQPTLKAIGQLPQGLWIRQVECLW